MRKTALRGHWRRFWGWLSGANWARIAILRQMRFLKPITFGAILILAQVSALGAEVAVLRNGFSIRFERKEQTGNLTRLYTGSGYMDIASDQIASFEVEEAPIVPSVPAPQPVAIQQSAAPVTPAVSLPVPLAKTATNVDLDQVVRDASSKNRLDPDFVSSVIKAESNFKPRAVSRKGPQRLMQLIPGTAAQLGVADPFDPRANVEAVTAPPTSLLDQYYNNSIQTLCVLNTGRQRVKKIKR